MIWDSEIGVKTCDYPGWLAGQIVYNDVEDESGPLVIRTLPTDAITIRPARVLT